VRLDHAARTPLNGLAIRLGGVGYGERDVLDAVAVAGGVPPDLVVLAKRTSPCSRT